MSDELIGVLSRDMKPRNWNALQHTAKESSHTESTLELVPKLNRKYLCQGPSTFPVLPSSHWLRPAVLSPPCGQPLCDPHSPEDFCQELLMTLVWLNSLNPNSNPVKTTLIVRVLKMRKLTVAFVRFFRVTLLINSRAWIQRLGNF